MLENFGRLVIEYAIKNSNLVLVELALPGGCPNGGILPGAFIASHGYSSLRQILFCINAHSVSAIAERLGEALGDTKAVERFLIKYVGISTSEININRTSGLDYNRITP